MFTQVAIIYYKTDREKKKVLQKHKKKGESCFSSAWRSFMEKFFEPDRQNWCGKDFQNTCFFFFFNEVCMMEKHRMNLEEGS